MKPTSAKLAYSGGTGELPGKLWHETAWVGSGYDEGRITYMHCSLQFKRFGDEWLLIDMVAMPVP